MNSTRKNQGNSFEAYELAWDSEYFNIPSAKVVLMDQPTNEESKVLTQFTKKFEFITYTNPGNNPKCNIWLGQNTAAYLADINVQFLKELSTDDIRSVSDSTEVIEACPYNERIVEIATNSFKYSRFFNDPHLPIEKIKGFYAYWTECAFDKRGRFFAVSKRKDEIVGFILFSLDSETGVATIELIAIDPNAQGKKVGKELLAGMEATLFERKVKKVKVGTQIDNVKAIKFYTGNGFVYTGCNSIYHYWPHK